MGFLLFGGALAAAYCNPLFRLVRLASGSELHSHIVLVPFISAYLIYIRRHLLPTNFRTAALPALIAGGCGLGAMIWVLAGAGRGFPASENDQLSLWAFSFVCFLLTGGFLFLGSAFLKAVAFPAAFLFFIVPLPDRVADSLETASKFASAEAADWLLSISGTPFLRDANIFQLPGITIEVAQECSGIRSSLVLFITSLLAANLFLRTTWRRVLLVALVIPLGIIRNGFRISVIGWLCVNVGRHMIDSPIHHRGGPIFFALSLIPLFLVLAFLRRNEHTKAKRKQSALLPSAV